jgi:hypothetical protein
MDITMVPDHYPSIQIFASASNDLRTISDECPLTDMFYQFMIIPHDGILYPVRKPHDS